MRALTPVILTAALLAAGCLAPATAPRPGAESPDEPASGAQPRAEGCSGFALDARLAGRHPRAHVPEGWATQQGASRVRLQGWVCERLAWGPFERGPVRFVLETHNQQVTPVACRQADRLTDLEVLQSMWIDDVDVAAYLHAEGLPAQAAAIDVQEDEAADGVTVLQWTWGPSGMATVQLLAPDGSVPATEQARRLFWDDGARITSMDVVATWSAPGTAAGPGELVGRSAAVGEFAPPMLLGDGPLPGDRRGSPATAPANAFDAAQWRGTLQHYGDLQCAPVS